MVKDNFISVYEEKPWVSQALHLGEEEALSYSCCHMTDQFHMMKRGDKIWRKSEEAQRIRESRLRKEINCK